LEGSIDGHMFLHMAVMHGHRGFLLGANLVCVGIQHCGTHHYRTKGDPRHFKYRYTPHDGCNSIPIPFYSTLDVGCWKGEVCCQRASRPVATSLLHYSLSLTPGPLEAQTPLVCTLDISRAISAVRSDLPKYAFPLLFLFTCCAQSFDIHTYCIR